MDKSISDESIKDLQSILQKKGLYLTIEDVWKVGNDLIEFFEVLSDEKKAAHGAEDTEIGDQD